MNKSLRFFWMMVLLVVLILSTACTLRASTPPAPTQEQGVLFPTPTSVANAVQTQTAQAQPQIATATPQVEAPTPVPQQAEQPQPTAQAPQPQPIPTLERPSTYTLQKGEWPICIARRYDLDLNALFSLNGLNMNSRPAVGTVLKIPSSGNWNEAAYGPRALRKHTDYKVAAGDTVYTIACYFGDVSPEAILAANGLNSASDVKPGMTLKIP